MIRRLLRILALFAAIVAVVAIAVLAWLVRAPGPMAFAGDRPVALADYKASDPTGVPASLAKASLIQRGEYLARAADCMACHTRPGGTPYAGGRGFALPFGTLYSTNITSDPETGIGRYTDAQFLAALHRGTRRDGQPLYPAMPFTAYALMTDADALAIKAYLFSLPPVRSPAVANTLGFPFDRRGLMRMWSGLFASRKAFTPYPGRSPQWNRGAYLAEGLAHCGECHTPRNLAFALDNRHKFAGALTAGWQAHNITADRASGLGGWSDADLARYLAQGFAPGHGVAAGPMGEAVDLGLRFLTPEDRAALVVYLRTVPAIANVPARIASAADDLPAASASPGEATFAASCAGCHEWSGGGLMDPFAQLTGIRTVNDPSGANVAQVVIAGVHRDRASGLPRMPAFGAAYSDREIADLANYVAQRFGHQAPGLTEKRVKALRDAAGE